jgi:hypothetical protein
LTDKITTTKQDHAERGLYETGAILIADNGTRSGWPEGQISMCLTQFGHWLSLAVTDPSVNLIHVINLYPSLLWRCFGTSSHWDVLNDYADVVLSLPAAQAENGRIFSSWKYVIGERGGRSKNDLVTERLRARMEQTLHASNV